MGAPVVVLGDRPTGLLVKATAGELPGVNLEDALEVALLVIEHEPENAERAALRWLGRYCLEHPGVTLAQVREALDAFSVLVEIPDAAEARLRRISSA